MKSLYFIRHGQSLANTGAVSMPDIDIPLTDLGLQQAIDLKNKWQIQPEHLYCSELKRAQQTAQVFADAYQKQPMILKELNEFRCLDFKTVEGLQGHERVVFAQQYWQTADLKHQDGDDADSFQDFVSRVDQFLQQTENFKHNSVFFGHGIWIGLLAWRLMNCPMTNNQDMQKFRQYQTALPMFNTVVYQLNIEGDVKQINWFPI